MKSMIRSESKSVHIEEDPGRRMDRKGEEELKLNRHMMEETMATYPEREREKGFIIALRGQV